MRLLAAGGAVETYDELQRQISIADGRLSELIERRAIVDRWKNTSRHLQLRSAELTVQISTDLDYHVCAELTGESADGSLFGFRY